MTKAEVIAKCAKGLKSDKLKSYLLAACSGIITGLMYKIGVSAGEHATCQKVAEMIPEEEYISVEEAENEKDAD